MAGRTWKELPAFFSRAPHGINNSYFKGPPQPRGRETSLVEVPRMATLARRRYLMYTRCSQPRCFVGIHPVGASVAAGSVASGVDQNDCLRSFAQSKRQEDGSLRLTVYAANERLAMPTHSKIQIGAKHFLYGLSPGAPGRPHPPPRHLKVYAIKSPERNIT